MKEVELSSDLDLTAAEFIVERAYRAILRRRVDREGLASYSAALVSGNLDEAGLIREMLASAEYKETFCAPKLSLAEAEGIVVRSYRAILRRAPDQDGLVTHSSAIAAGDVDEASLIRAMIESAEFDELMKKEALSRDGLRGQMEHQPVRGFTELDARYIVRQAYESILNRQPDQVGFDAHSARLIAGEISLSDLFEEFKGSPEKRAQASGGGREVVVHGLEDPLRLAQDYSVEAATWDRYLFHLFDRHVHSGGENGGCGLRRLHLVVEPAGGDIDDYARTLHAIAGLQAASSFSVTAAIVLNNASLLRDKVEEMLCGRERDVALNGDREAALEGLADDDLIFWLRAGDAPRPELGPALSRYIREETTYVTLDSYFSAEGRIFPVLQPGANATQVLNCDSLFSRYICRAVEASNQAFGSRVDIIQILRGWIRSGGPLNKWRHIALPLLELRLTPAELVSARDDIILGERPFQSVKCERNFSGAKVSVVICTKDKGNLLFQLVQRLLVTAADRLAEIIIVSNNTRNVFASQAFAHLCAQSSIVKVVEYNHPFNFSAQSNLGARLASGEFILMLNDDIVPITNNWIEALLSPFADPDIGLTGPLLLYPDERVQHAGMFVGYSGSAGHSLRFASIPNQDYLFTTSAPRNVSVITGAVMLMTREAFDASNGFDELLASYLQDVDLCLRLLKGGFKIIFTPAARLIHMESASVHEIINDHSVNENRGREHSYFARRWKRVLQQDDYHNPMFDPADESFRTLRVY